jgi:adenine-specific DNA-methyltransferase
MPTLQFKGKSVIETYHHTVPHHRLEFDAKLSCLPEGEKPSLEGNLIIEGDNLLALKALLPTHAGKVKCIYIDPPYNTGNEGCRADLPSMYFALPGPKRSKSLPNSE